MKILLSGCKGQIGTAICQFFLQSNFRNKIDLITAGKEQLDITDARQVDVRINTLRPDVVINSAAYTKVDQAESNIDRAFAVNLDGPTNLARACSKYSVKLIHISTDFVFDGCFDGAYVENATVNPLNVYGQSKAAGEAAVREYCEQHVILRTAWAYSSWGDNFMKVIANRILEGHSLKVVNDQFGSPTAATDIAKAIWAIGTALGDFSGEGTVKGTFHFTGQGIATWYDFAKRIADRVELLTGISPAIEPVPTSGYPTAAKRPSNSVLNCEKFAETFKMPPTDWRLAVDREVDLYIKDVYAGKVATVA